MWFLLFLLGTALITSSGGDSSCSCGEFLRQRVVTNPSEKCYWHARETYVRSLAQAEYLCGQTTIGEHPCTWMIVSAVTAPIPNVQVSATSSETVALPLFRVQIADVKPSSLPDRRACTSAVNEGAVIEFQRLPSPMGDVWTDKCSTPVCPSVPVGTFVNPQIWSPFATGGTIMCNMDKCRADGQGGCSCNPTTRQCECNQLNGQPGLWTGGACGKFRLEVCASSDPPMTFAEYMEKRPLQSAPNEWAAKLSVCNFKDDMMGRASCQFIGGRAQCSPCQADARPPNARVAVQGPFCNVSMCRPACSKIGGTCHRVCLDQLGRRQYCYACTGAGCVPQPAAVCVCDQQLTQTYFGERCDKHFNHNAFLPSSPADDPFFAGCYTGFDGDGYPAWNDLALGQPNPRVCGGHGVCREDGVYGKCDCDKGFLQSTRCTTIDRCLAECTQNKTRATCRNLSPSRISCTCSALWYGDTCDDDGCAAGSVVNGVCVCPAGTVWMPRTPGEPPQKRVGCRITCPRSASTGQECGDGDVRRCSGGFAPGPPGVCYCESDGWTSDGHGSCEPLCKHDGTWSSALGCTCAMRLGFDGQMHSVWAGARCDVSLCQHGTTWQNDLGRCQCSQAAPPFNVPVGDDLYCSTPYCSPPRKWDGANCVCQFPYDAASCASLCGPHGAPTGGAACTCSAGWRGRQCNESLCLHGGQWQGDHCVCTAVWSGQRCETTLCAGNGQTREITDSRCVCSTSLVSGPFCEQDRCAPLGDAVYSSHDGSWQCLCRAYAYPLEGGMRCGCPSPQRMLDPCRDPDDVGLDPRCLSFTGDGHQQRCICRAGQDVDKSGACVPLQCYAAGTNQTHPFRLVDGYWTCVCKSGWSGHLCGSHEHITNDAACGYNGTWTGEQCLCDPVLPVVHVVDASTPRGQYCALDCWNDGVYQFVKNRCLCVDGWTGWLCQESTRPPPPPPPSSSSTGASVVAVSTNSHGLAIGLGTAGGAVALAAIITGIVLGIKKMQ